MKKIIFLLIFSQYISAQNDKGVFVGNYNYGVSINQGNLSMGWAATRWYCNIIEDDNFRLMFKEMVKGIKSGELKTKSSVESENFLDTAAAYKKLMDCRTLYVQDVAGNDGNEMTQCDEWEWRDNIYLSFNEDWFYNAGTNILTKEVKGMSLGKYLEDKDGGKIAFYIPLFPEKFSRPDFNFSGVYAVDGAYSDLEPDANFHFFKNKLLAKAEKDYSLLRDTLFPFTQKIDDAKFASVTDSFQRCFNYGFYEDWSYDSKNFAFTKKVLAIGFYRNVGFVPRDLKPRGTFIFGNFKNYQPENNVQSFPEQFVERNSALPTSDSIGKTDSMNFKGIQRFADKIIAKILNRELDAVSNYNGENDMSFYTLPEFQDRFEKTFTKSSFDSKGKEIISTTKVVDKTIQNLSFYQTLTFDFEKNNFFRKTNYINFSQFNTEKEFYKPLFGIAGRSDSSYVPTETDLVCKNASTQISFQTDNDFREGTFWSESGFSTYINNIGIKNRYEFFVSLFRSAESGKTVFYKPGTDTPFSLKEISDLKDTLTLQSLGKTELPTFFLPINEMRFIEDWYYNETKNIFFIKTNELTFFRTNQFDSGNKEAVFTLKWK